MLKSEKERLWYFSNVFSEVREYFCYRNGKEKDEKAEEIREILTDIARYGFTSSYFGDKDRFREAKEWCKSRIVAVVFQIDRYISYETATTNIGRSRKTEEIAKCYSELAVLYKARFVFDGLICLGIGIKLSDFLSDRMFEEIEDDYIYKIANKRNGMSLKDAVSSEIYRKINGFDEDNEESEEEE